MRARWIALVVLTVTLVACGGAQAPAGSTAAPITPSPAPQASPQPSLEATPTEPPALVGTWLGVHNCQRIFDLMTQAGMPEQALANIADAGVLPGVHSVTDIADPSNPCPGAVDVKHSHFFTADGRFGSRDANGQKVDDGSWRLVDATTFEICGSDIDCAPFHYRIDADGLHLEPVSVGPCPTDGQWCREAWKLMVAMPGMAWTRG